MSLHRSNLPPSFPIRYHFPDTTNEGKATPLAILTFTIPPNDPLKPALSHLI